MNLLEMYKQLSKEEKEEFIKLFMSDYCEIVNKEEAKPIKIEN